MKLVRTLANIIIGPIAIVAMLLIALTWGAIDRIQERLERKPSDWRNAEDDTKPHEG